MAAEFLTEVVKRFAGEIVSRLSKASGGLSGASLDRPALQSLSDQVRAKRIDIVVVYKVDRLTRSLADFAKLVELFDEHEVSFVSVTQSFNTTSSMGRLTLNVLLSFAQFEREVIGERVRDKIAASKRKGIWVGGMVPLGYRAVNKKLEIVREEADLVRRIFALYIELGSVGALASALDQQGVRPKPRQLANGRSKAAERYTIGPLAHMLKNRLYVGEVAYRGEVHKGEHPAIVDREVFDRVQAMLAERSAAPTVKRGNSPHLLTGLIFDDRGNPMSPTHANKKGVRYRYYTSHALLQRRKEHAGSVPRVSAPEVEALVCEALRRDVPAPETEISDRDLVAQHVSKVIVRRHLIDWRGGGSFWSLTVVRATASVDCLAGSSRIGEGWRISDAFTLKPVIRTIKMPTTKRITPGAASFRFVEKPKRDAVQLVCPATPCRPSTTPPSCSVPAFAGAG